MHGWMDGVWSKILMLKVLDLGKGVDSDPPLLTLKTLDVNICFSGRL